MHAAGRGAKRKAAAARSGGVKQPLPSGNNKRSMNHASKTTRSSLLRRIVRQLQRIGPRPLLLLEYVLHHARTRFQRRRLRSTYAAVVAHSRARTRVSLFQLELPRVKQLPPELVPAAERIRIEADHILAHRVDLLGSGIVDLGPDIDWHRDFKSGYRWEPNFYQDVGVTRLTDSSDAKVPWELSRGHHLLTLARAGAIFEDERCAREVENQLESWLDANPPGFGINWVNTMEVALRAVNWIWTLATLEAWHPIDGPLRQRVAEALGAHGRHIARNLEGTPYLRSNHYLADVLGLLVLGATLEDDAEASQWLEVGRAAFEREIRTQILDDGLGFEASLPYHALVLEMFLLARVTASRVDRPLSDRFDERVRRALEASRAVRHPGGRLPQFGDSDSGRVLPAGFARPATIDHVLWLGAAIFGGTRPLEQSPHEEVAWTLGVDAWERAAALPPAPPDTRSAFPHSGLFVLRGERVHVVARCGDLGQNGNGGHAHNDVLTFEASFGEPLVVDSGTYVYTSDPLARNVFRGTAAHNTVMVEDSEMNPIEQHELFRLKQVALPRVEHWEERAQVVRLVASHDGYRRLPTPVRHRRTFELDRRTSSLLVRDELLGTGRIDARAYLHLAPSTSVIRVDEHTFRLERRDCAVSLSLDGVVFDVLDGWVSDRFGVRDRAPVLVGRVAGELPLEFAYRLSPEPIQQIHASAKEAAV